MKSCKYIVVESYRRLIQILVGLEIFEFPVLCFLRVALLKSCFSIGRKLVIGCHVHFTRQHRMYDGKLRIGDFCTIGNSVSIDFSGDVIIENNVTISAGAIIMSHKHDIIKMAKGDHSRNNTSACLTQIKYGAWIGTNAIVLPGVTIGEGSVVGAGAVVTKDVAPFTFVGGNPAQYIKSINDSTC